MIGNNFIGILGALLVLITSYDAIRTTLSATQAGPLTNRILSLLWSLLIRLPQSRHKHHILASAGMWFSLMLVITWLVLTWAGWFLLFCSTFEAVVNASTSAPATLIERAYFTGYTVTTLGYGDFVPGDADWRMPATIAAANGFFLFTLTVTYMLNVISSVTQKRQLALNISAMGQTPYQILESSTDEGEYQSLSLQVLHLQQAINTVGQQHLAFPILHYFHSVHSDTALPLALTRLYHALTLACYGCSTLSPSTRSQLVSAQHTLEQFMITLGSAFITPKKDMPDIPDLTEFAKLPGFDKSPSELQAYLESLDQQKLLLAYIQKDGWEWRDVWHPPKKT
ncbi:potassium channel family protein [Modicisalibacter luteus]|uniref:Potassium channel family protein n=1 Tax=Modicisalibacter luteus TaxID=453962 RepID=A0ABV7M1U6_9GAMM|nr:potassium channel family protein [Halomonas lutea]GHA92132.1 putative membrane protein YdjJ [Halomonas lutea]